jgi:type II secretory pathway pseudopilin PulG
MHLSNESLIVILIVGIVAGWLAGNIVRRAGFENLDSRLSGFSA